MVTQDGDVTFPPPIRGFWCPDPARSARSLAALVAGGLLLCAVPAAPEPLLLRLWLEPPWLRLLPLLEEPSAFEIAAARDLACPSCASLVLVACRS